MGETKYFYGKEYGWLERLETDSNRSSEHIYESIPAWRQTMRSFFYCATLSSVLAFTSSVPAADGVFTKSFDTDAMIHANDDSVIPASCERGTNCSDNSDSSGCGLSCPRHR